MKARTVSGLKGKDGQAGFSMHLIRFTDTMCGHAALIHLSPEAP